MTSKVVTSEQARQDHVLARARLELREDMAGQRHRLSDGWGGQLLPPSSDGSLIHAVAASVIESGFELHDCAAATRTGGVCLAPGSQQPGVIVTWTTHDALRFDNSRSRIDRDVHELMNYALCGVLTALGWDVRPFGHASAHMVHGRRSIKQEGAAS